MGTDFLRNKRERHEKAWRRNLANAANDMFAPAPKVRRVIRAKSEPQLSLVPQQPVLLRLIQGGKVVASDGVHQVATVERPSAALLATLKEHHNVAPGKVRRVNCQTNSVELQLED